MDYKDAAIKVMRQHVLYVLEHGDLAHYAAHDALAQLKDSWEAMISDGVPMGVVDRAIRQDIEDTIVALREFIPRWFA